MLVQMDMLGCDEEYNMESARTFAERLKEPLKEPSPIYKRQLSKGNSTSVKDFSMVGIEAQLC